jgi:hypothetical protein
MSAMNRVVKSFATAVLLLPLFVASCATVYVNGDNAAMPISLSAEARADASHVGHFRCQGRALYALWGLVPLMRPDAGAMASEQATGADAVVNLRVTAQLDLLDVLVLALLGPVSLVTLSVVVEGDMVTYKDTN